MFAISRKTARRSWRRTRRLLTNIGIEAGLLESSRHGEAAFLHGLVRPDFPPYLVDVGAHDGRTYSNSFAFLRSGWHGILIEPLPSVFQKLQRRYRNNPRVTCLNLACSNRPGQKPLFVGADGAEGFMSTLCTDQNDWFARNRSTQNITVNIDTLTNILKNKNFPADFSILLIDAEAMDLEVLQGLDFELFRPRIIITEEYKPKVQAKHSLLGASGYQLAGKTGSNTVWTREG